MCIYSEIEVIKLKSNQKRMNQIMKSTLVFYLIACVSMALAHPAAAPIGEIDYWEDNMNFEDDESFSLDHLSITSAPKENINYPAEPIEAECRVSGMPVPTVEWVHGTALKEDHDFESNSIVETSASGMATVVARLIIKPHHYKPGTTRTFTCVGRSGAKVVKASTTVHFNHEAKNPRATGNGLFEAIVGAEKTKIYEFYESLFETIGNSVILPCKATAKADMYWISDAGKEITGKEPRFRILPTGDLSISNIQFKDMGTYLCLARNSVSKDVISTFLYPLAPTTEKRQ